MPNNSIISFLKEQLQLPLPGKEAQYKLATKTRTPYKNKTTPKEVRLASVLCLLYPKNDHLFIPLIQRVIAINDKHSGQISFPGGKLEPTDKSCEDGALREANEEIGIQPKDVSIIGRLTPLYVPVSNFQVFPFVGYLNYAPKFTAQEKEVAEIVEVALEELIAPETLKYKSMSYKDKFTVKNVPYFDVNDKTIWGATAMMLNELIEVINQVKSSTI